MAEKDVSTPSAGRDLLAQADEGSSISDSFNQLNLEDHRAVLREMTGPNSATGLPDLVVSGLDFDNDGKPDANDLSGVTAQSDAAGGNTGDLAELPPVSEYNGDADNTPIVYQGDAVVLDVENNPNVEGLHTFGAGPCPVLVLVSRDENGKVTKVAMAHIDGAVDKEGIEKLVKEMGGNVEASVISGDTENAAKVAEVLEENNVKTKFVNTDPDGKRDDSVTVDRDGNVYYGDSADLLANLDFEKIQKILEERLRVGEDPNPENGGLNLKVL